MKDVQEHLQHAISELSQLLQLFIISTDSNAATASQLSHILIGVISTLSSASILTTCYIRKHDSQEDQSVKLITDLRQAVERQQMQIRSQTKPKVECSDAAVNTPKYCIETVGIVYGLAAVGSSICYLYYFRTMMVDSALRTVIYKLNTYTGRSGGCEATHCRDGK